ncbi:hypothetical protein EYF80_048574 [Liparis tanakae]|uniref:Uncharacterized protein n=1 Tax=Liparis tanakae TaxID=230148 RepID=A0A4Z2FJ94_9TELE|nr:hypothetical protein EYF80_048574 [Liparis tanakae]
MIYDAGSKPSGPPRRHAALLTCCGGGSLPRLVSRLRMLRSDICRRPDTGGMRESMLGSRVTSAFITALAGLFPPSDSLDRCWCDSARHSTSEKRVLRAMAGSSKASLSPFSRPSDASSLFNSSATDP